MLRSERPDVDKKRSDLLKLQGEFAVRLRQLEKALLAALNESKGKILDDNSVIGTLEKLKTEAAEVASKAAETDRVMAEVKTLRIEVTKENSFCRWKQCLLNTNVWLLPALSSTTHCNSSAR